MEKRSLESADRWLRDSKYPCSFRGSMTARSEFGICNRYGLAHLIPQPPWYGERPRSAGGTSIASTDPLKRVVRRPPRSSIAWCPAGKSMHIQDSKRARVPEGLALRLSLNEIGQPTSETLDGAPKGRHPVRVAGRDQ